MHGRGGELAIEQIPGHRLIVIAHRRGFLVSNTGEGIEGQPGDRDDQLAGAREKVMMVCAWRANDDQLQLTGIIKPHRRPAQRPAIPGFQRDIDF